MIRIMSAQMLPNGVFLSLQKHKIQIFFFSHQVYTKCIFFAFLSSVYQKMICQRFLQEPFVLTTFGQFYIRKIYVLLTLCIMIRAFIHISVSELIQSCAGMKQSICFRNVPSYLPHKKYTLCRYHRINS